MIFQSAEGAGELWKTIFKNCKILAKNEEMPIQLASNPFFILISGHKTRYQKPGWFITNLHTLYYQDHTYDFECFYIPNTTS